MKRNSKNTGRAISMALAAALAIAPVNAFAASSDINGHWAEKTITAWQDKGLISGYQDGTFKPNKPTTRAEFTRIMNQALGLDKKGNVAFTDVSPSDWFYHDVAIALGEAYTAGYPDGTFKPNEIITRAQAAVFIANAIGSKGGSVASFTDSASIPAWARDSVGAIVEKGYMSGYPDGSFKPNAVLTRAEAVSTLNRIMGIADDKKDTTVTDKDVVIEKDDAKLENQTVEGNVIISEKVGNGEVYLKNVEIKGDLIIQGGGDDSIYIEDTTVDGKTVVDKKNVRLQVSGKTKLSKVQVKKACNLNAKNFAGEVEAITIEGEISDQITIGVPADKLFVDKKANLVIKKDIGRIIIEKDAEGTKLEVEKDAQVSTLTADGKVALSGNGTVSRLEANVSGITYTSGLTISKTETASGEKEPTKTTGNNGGSSSNDSSSSKKKSISVSSATELKSAIEENRYATINVAHNITGDVVANCAGSRNFTINFGTFDVDGNLSITAPNVSSIILSDTGNEAAGSQITGNLTIDAQNAEVTNSVMVVGNVIIKAVKQGTLNIIDKLTGSINMEGRGKVNVSSTVNATPTVNVNTDEPVELAGKLGKVDINHGYADVKISASIVGEVLAKGDAENRSLTIATAAPVQIGGKFSLLDMTAPSAQVTLGGTFDAPGVRVHGANTTISVAATAIVPQVQTTVPLIIAGAGTVDTVDVKANNVTVTVNGTASVSEVVAVNGITGTTIAGDTTAGKPTAVTTKALAPTGLDYVVAASPTEKGQITGTTTAMEYRLSTEGTYHDCTTTNIEVAPGVYYVRVKATGTEGNPGYISPSDEVEVIVYTHVNAVTGINYEVRDESVRLAFTQPTSNEGIDSYLVEFSKDGITWENSYTIHIADNSYCNMEDITRELRATTTYTQVRVTSVAVEDSYYLDNAETLTTPYTFTVSSEKAPAFTVVKTAEHVYDLTITDDVVADAIYVVDITKDGSTPDGYPLGYAISSSSFENKKCTIDSSLEDEPIVDGSSFTLRVVKPYTTTGMTVTQPSAKVTASLELKAAPDLVNGLTFADDDTNDSNTIISLGAPSMPGNTFAYKLSDNGSAVPTPNVGDNLREWTPIVNGSSIPATNGQHIGVAEVNESGLAVQFSDGIAVVEAEALSISSVAVSGNAKVGETLTLTVTMSDGQPAGNRVEYFAAVQEASDSTGAVGNISIDTTSNTMAIPATFTLNLGGSESIVGKYIDYGAKIKNVMNSGKSDDPVGPILAADTVLIGSLTVSSADDDLSDTNTVISVTEANEGHTRLYKNFGSGAVTLPVLDEVITVDTNGWTAFPQGGIMAATNGDKIVVVDVLTTDDKAKFVGQSTAVVESEATEVTASSNGIATATGTTRITLGAAVAGLAAEDIVVKNGTATLVKDIDYTLSSLSGTSFDITFLPKAALDNTSSIIVEMTKTGYVINGGLPIAVTNTIALPDTTAPTLSGVSAARTSETAGTITFTSNETGTYKVVVSGDGATAPEATKEAFDGLNGDATACTKDTEVSTAAITLTASAANVYILVKDASDNVVVSTVQDIAAYEAPDTTAPTLSSVNATRTNETEGTAKFTSDEDGTYEVIVVVDGATAPTAFTGTGTACTKNTEVTEAITLTSAASDVYVLVKDAKGNLKVSDKIDIAVYEAPLASGIDASVEAKSNPEAGKVMLKVSTAAADATHAIYYRVVDTEPTAMHVGDVLTVSDEWKIVSGTDSFEVAAVDGKYIEIAEFTTDESKVTKWGKTGSTDDGVL